jgi:beta-galactosidase GanA
MIMWCSAKRTVLCVGLLLALRLLWANIFPSGTTALSGGKEDTDQLDIKAIDFNLGMQSDDEETDKYSKGLEYQGRQFFLNGKPIRIIGGSFHYFRTRPEQWEDRLERMKAAGLNTVTTYIAWNVHERRRGVYDFSADGYDLVQFIRIAHKLGFYMILRPGPYICAEWEFGGFPSWLLHDPNMQLRTSVYKPYFTHVERFFTNLLPLLKKYNFRRGGPIIAYQVENEFGNSATSPDVIYLRFIVSQFRKHGIKELLLTSDSSYKLANGTLEDILATANFNKNAAENLNRLLKFGHGKYPLMVTEFWPGWFDHWGEKHHVMEEPFFRKQIEIVLSYNASINFYMFTGGTNFGFWNGANGNRDTYAPTITSYDYDALVSECGDIHPTKYQALRDLLVKFGLVSKSDLLPPPENPRKVAYGQLKVEQSMTLEVMRRVGIKEPFVLKDPIFMEFLGVNDNGGQGYGWILYRSQIRGSSVEIRGVLHDRAHIFINGQLVDTIYSYNSSKIDRKFSIESPGAKDGMLDILVENMGRVNYGEIKGQRKGFQGEVSVDGNKVETWEHYPLEFNPEFIKDIQDSNEWQKPAKVSQTMPSLYRGSLRIEEKPEDTFLDMSEWTKGIVIVNGFVIGRYWNVGPQQTLYVPWPVLNKGANDIIVFELEKSTSHLTFIDHPLLGSRHVNDT